MEHQTFNAPCAVPELPESFRRTLRALFDHGLDKDRSEARLYLTPRIPSREVRDVLLDVIFGSQASNPNPQ